MEGGLLSAPVQQPEAGPAPTSPGLWVSMHVQAQVQALFGFWAVYWPDAAGVCVCATTLFSEPNAYEGHDGGEAAAAAVQPGCSYRAHTHGLDDDLGSTVGFAPAPLLSLIKFNHMPYNIAVFIAKNQPPSSSDVFLTFCNSVI